MAAGTAPVEVLERSGGPSLPRRGRRVLAVAVVILCVAGLVAWWLGARARERDEQAVAQCRAAASSADVRASALVGSMVEQVAPLMWKVSDRQRDGLVALVAEAARRAVPGVAAALVRCRRTHVDWWHRDAVQERDRYVAYLAARVDRLEDVAADGHHYYRDQPRLAALRDQAFGP